MIVLKAEQVARMQRWKDEKHEANKRMLVSDIYTYIYFVWIKRSLLLLVPYDCFTLLF
jgi:hypothetical protein